MSENGERCDKCYFWRLILPCVAETTNDLKGFCHFDPPTLLGDELGNPQTVAFPDVSANWWCGQFRAAHPQPATHFDMTTLDRPSMP